MSPLQPLIIHQNLHVSFVRSIRDTCQHLSGGPLLSRPPPPAECRPPFWRRPPPTGQTQPTTTPPPQRKHPTGRFPTISRSTLRMEGRLHAQSNVSAAQSMEPNQSAASCPPCLPVPSSPSTPVGRPLPSSATRRPPRAMKNRRSRHPVQSRQLVSDLSTSPISAPLNFWPLHPAPSTGIGRPLATKTAARPSLPSAHAKREKACGVGRAVANSLSTDGSLYSTLQTAGRPETSVQPWVPFQAHMSTSHGQNNHIVRIKIDYDVQSNKKIRALRQPSKNTKASRKTVANPGCTSGCTVKPLVLRLQIEDRNMSARPTTGSLYHKHPQIALGPA